MINAERIPRDIVTIGASAGGVQALTDLLGYLPSDVPAGFAIVLHRSPYFETRLPSVIGRRSQLRILEPDGPADWHHGVVYVAPRDRHLVVEDSHVVLSRRPKEHRTRPAIDPLFSSAAAALGPRVVGVLLSGMGEDGVSGLIDIKAAGGVTIVQSPSEAKFRRMPDKAISDDHVDAILSIAGIASLITLLARGAPVESALAATA